MPDVLNVPSGPGNHRPHRDYEDTRAYCAECYQPWPCRAHREETPTMPATRKVKVRCSDRDGPDHCGWSGERPATPDPTTRRCPWCHCQTVELVGRTNLTRQEA